MAFYILAAGLIAGSVYNARAGRTPETTVAGIAVSSVSLLTMWLLMRLKIRVGRALSSEAVVADAHCTRACLQLSAVLLIASALYEWLAVPYIDAAGSLLIAFLSIREGREAFSKARGSRGSSSARRRSS